jgi:flavin reductase (DIM6/NTAB) family NADH-FMN oxidoreductase RutF
MSDARFEAFDWRSLGENPSRMFAEDWALLSPGSPDAEAGGARRWNTMTVSWGAFGQLWGMDVALVFVRPSRHSFGYMEGAEGFTLSFLEEGMRPALQVCGSMSGRDGDKAEAAGLSPRPFALPGGPRRVGFDEARLVVSCRKVHSQDLDPSRFLDQAIAACYPKGDVHRLYAGAIEGAWRASRGPVAGAGPAGAAARD